MIETTAKTKEEAIEIALKELDADRGEVEIDVVSAGKSGILGIGSEPAKVRVTLLDKPTDVVKATSEVLDSLMSKLGVSVVVSLKQAERPDLGGPVFEIEGDDSGLLIGRRGETLKSLQFLVRVIVGRRLQARANLLLDVEGYQERRNQTLTNMALNVAQRVAATGQSIPLEPMPPDERRIVHMALAEHAQVTTESMGDGDGRQVVVQPKEE
jgi:spoIIIJ-associated protein